MVTGAKYYVQFPVLDEPSIINHGPFDTLPKAREAAERLKKGWSRQKHHTPRNMPHIRIVKVIEDIYIGGSE